MPQNDNYTLIMNQGWRSKESSINFLSYNTVQKYVLLLLASFGLLYHGNFTLLHYISTSWIYYRLTFKSMGKILWPWHSNEPYRRSANVCIIIPFYFVEFSQWFFFLGPTIMSDRVRANTLSFFTGWLCHFATLFGAKFTGRKFYRWRHDNYQ